MTNMSIDETSTRYDGWRIVAVCFLVAGPVSALSPTRSASGSTTSAAWQ
jgi:hypothetical protein